MFEPTIYQDEHFSITRTPSHQLLLTDQKTKEVLVKADFAFDIPDACALLSNIKFAPSLNDDNKAKYATIFYENIKEFISNRIPDNRKSDLLIYASPEIIHQLHSAKTQTEPGHYDALMIRPAHLPLAGTISLEQLKTNLNAEKVEIIEDKQILSENAEPLCKLMLEGAHWAQVRKYTSDFMRKLINASTTSTALRVQFPNGKVEWACFVRTIASTDNGLYYVSDMCTHPDFQHKGCGGVVIQANLMRAPTGALGLLTVSDQYPGNIAGKKLYERFGFHFHKDYMEIIQKNGMELLFELIPSKALLLQEQKDRALSPKLPAIADSLQHLSFAPPKDPTRAVPISSDQAAAKCELKSPGI